MTNEERNERFDKICESLMEFSESFREFSKIGKVKWNGSIKTACISYSPAYSVLNFEWNPDFFDKNSDYKNKFIFCHEMLHILLNHGPRFEFLTNHKKANISMDIYINHFLLDCYGFIRSQIENWKNLCWRDTVLNCHVQKMPSFEGYYNLDDKFFNKGFEPLDDHNFIQPNKINDGSGSSIQEITEEFLKESGKAFESASKKKRKFEGLVKNITASLVEKSLKKSDSWSISNRRFSNLTEDIPTEIKDRQSICHSKYKCLFFIDNSGSCSNFQQRFCDVANSLNEKVFDIEVFTFDTKLRKVNKENNKYIFYGGGGTNFSSITKHVESLEKLPDLIMVLTDGEASPIIPKHPKKYHWFITEGGTTKSLKNAGKLYRLSQFE